MEGLVASAKTERSLYALSNGRIETTTIIVIIASDSKDKDKLPAGSNAKVQKQEKCEA